MSEARFLNLDLGSAVASCQGVVFEDGALRLAELPADPQPVGDELGRALGGPAGMATDRHGNLYVADPETHLIRVVDCSGAEHPLRCLRGPGDRPGELRGARGVAVDSRGRLWVADTGNHRIQSVDLESGQLAGIFGQPNPYGPSEPGAGRGRFHSPADVAIDSSDRVYVADTGNHRVVRLRPDGWFDDGFAEAMAVSVTKLHSPTQVMIGTLDSDEVRLLVIDGLDDGGTDLLAFELDGAADTEQTERWREALGPVGGVALTRGVLYVTDSDAARVMGFDTGGRFLGVIPGWSGEAAALALDADGRLVVRSAAGSAVRFGATAPARSGTAVIGPIEVPGGTRPVSWHAVRVSGSAPAGASVRIYSRSSNTRTPPPQAPAGDTAAGPEIAPLGQWRAAPAGARDALLLNAPAEYLWIALRLSAGSPSPAVTGVRVDWDADTWLRHLPALYSRRDESRVFLERSLSLLERTLETVTDRLEELPRLLTAEVAPDGRDGGPWLDWLAGCVGAELDAGWDEPRRRDFVRRAFALNGRRGTARALEEAAELSFGAHVTVRPAAPPPSPWALGRHGERLGFDTQLGVAEAQGATLGTTATLDHSSLSGDGALGAPLFAAALRFCVRANAADFPSASRRDALVRLVERDRPAHAEYHVCFVEPTGRVGHQARVGVDAIVAGDGQSLRLGRGALGAGTRLGSAQRHVATFVGKSMLTSPSVYTREEI